MCAVQNGWNAILGNSFINRDFMPGKARVAIICGGCFQELAQDPMVAGADEVVYVDVTDEIAGAKTPTAVKIIALAQRETLAKLIQSVQSPQALKDFAKDRPGVLLSTGLGQIRRLGYLAVQKVLQDPNFAEWVNREVFEPLMLRHNGMLAEIEVAVFSSSGGGTGSGGALCFGRALSDYLLAHTPALVHLKNLRIGCLAFMGLGSRTRSNAAGALLEDVNSALSGNRHEREIRSLILSELPMDGEDKELRDMHAALFVRSMRTQSVRSTRDRGHINAALTSPLGAVTITRSAFYQPISARVVAGETCTKVLPAVETLLATGPDTDTVHNVRIVLKEDSGGVPSAADLMTIVRRSPKVMPEGFMDLCFKMPSYEPQAYVVLHDDMALATGTDFVRMLRQPCQAPEDYRHRIGVCNGVLKLNEDAANVEARKSSVLRASTEKAKQELCDTLNRLYPRGLWQGLAKAVSSPAANEQLLHNAIVRVRERMAESRQLEATLNARRAVRELVQSELDRICSPLRRLLAVLEGHRPVPGERRMPLVTVAEDSFAHILPNLDTCKTDRDFLSLLVRCVETVTTAGLARIVGAANDDAQSIVRALASNDPPTVSPWWGGAEPPGERQIIFVLPPVSAMVEDDLREVAQREWGGLYQLAVAGTAAGGLNVVRMEFVKPEHTSSLETPLLAATYEEEVAPQPHLFRTSDNGEVDRLHELAALEVRGPRTR